MVVRVVAMGRKLHNDLPLPTELAGCGCSETSHWAYLARMPTGIPSALFMSIAFWR